MKRAFFLVMLSIAFIGVSAQTTTTTTTTTVTKHKYYYYPSANVYYDDASGNYWYWDDSGSQWSMTQSLPSTITVTNTKRYPVMYSGDDPWKNNAADLKKYKVKKNGKMKAKGKS